ncbi:MAG: class I SAM-dependent methyltransferase [Candidatus Brocadiia bacterium]
MPTCKPEGEVRGWRAALRASLWLPKALCVNLLSRLPFSEHIHFNLQRLLGRHRLDGPEMFGRALELFRLHRHCGHDVFGKDVLEIGTGWFPFTPVMAQLLGARSVVTVDVHPWLRLGNMVRTIEELEPMLDDMARRVGAEAGMVHERHGRLLSAARETAALQDVLEAARIDYRCPCDLTKAPLPPESFDVVFSSNVLEHIPPDDLRRIHRQVGRLLRDGGLAIHRFNPGDHFVELTGSTVNFLRFSERAWRWLGGSGLSYHNRLRSCEHAGLLSEAGLGLRLWADALDREALRTELGRTVMPAEPFERMPAEFLAAYYTWFVAGRADGESVTKPARVRWIDALLDGPDFGPGGGDAPGEVGREPARSSSSDSL